MIRTIPGTSHVVACVQGMTRTMRKAMYRPADAPRTDLLGTEEQKQKLRAPRRALYFSVSSHADWLDSAEVSRVEAE